MIDRIQANIMTEKPTYGELEQKVKELEREIEEHEQRKKEFVAKEEGYRDIIETIADIFHLFQPPTIRPPSGRKSLQQRFPVDGAGQLKRKNGGCRRNN